jgi:serine/threonine protein kinase
VWPFRARATRRAESAVDAERLAPAASPTGPGERVPRHARWDFPEGAELATGRHVLRRLGGGSRYEVHLAWDESLFALVVAKVLRPDQVGDPRALRELRREAELVAALAHPGLVRGFGAVLDGPHPHLVHEHVEGPTLSRLVRADGPLALEQLLPLSLHALAVLHYLAQRGVVHLDVKPGNVVMSGPPRLIDLSIARGVDDARALRHAIGTDAYMAPEQCAPGPDAIVGPWSDVWALGATIFHAAVGRVPFPRAPGADRSGDSRVRFPQLAAPAPPVPPTLPPTLRGLLGAMLDPDPARRPSAREAAEALAPLVATVPTRLERTRRGRLVAPRWAASDQP